MFLMNWHSVGPDGSVDLAQLLFRMEQWESAEMTLAHVPILDKALLLSKVVFLYFFCSVGEILF